MSLKKMHPPAMVQPTAPIASRVSTATGGGKGSKDRQNAENIVPTNLQQNGLVEQVNSGKKMSNKASSVKAVAATTPTVVSSNTIKTGQSHVNGSSAISTLNTTNRRKSHRINSPNRKRREQLNVFNSLRAWNVKFVPSSQTTVRVDSGIDKKQSAVPGGGGSSSNEASKANSERSSSASSTTTSGSMSSSVSSNTSSSSSSISSSSNISDSIKENAPSKGKKRTTAAATVLVKEPSATDVTTAQSVKNKEDIAEPQSTASNDAKQTQNAPPPNQSTNGYSGTQGKLDKKLMNGSGGFSANHRHPSAVISPSHPSSSGSVIPSSSSSTVLSIPSSTSSTTTRSSLTSPVMSTPSPAVLTSSPTNHSRHNSSVNARATNAGKVLLPNVNRI